MGSVVKVPLEMWKEKCTEIHKGKYDYSITEFVYKSNKVKIICPVHGVFEQQRQDHYKGIGCKKCYYASQKQWTPEQDKFIIENYKEFGTKFCADALGKTENAVHGRAQILNAAKKQRDNHEHIPAYFWNSVVNRAKTLKVQNDEGIDFNRDYIWELYQKQNGKCALSGWPIKFAKTKKEGVTTASLDRIDSNQGYKKGNVQLTHKIVNRTKLNMPESAFFIMCRDVYKTKRDMILRKMEMVDDIWNDTQYPIIVPYEFNVDDLIMKESKVYFKDGIEQEFNHIFPEDHFSVEKMFGIKDE